MSVNGATLNYEVTGEGDPLLLIAGCGQPAIAWHLGLAPSLVAAGYRVATFDNRGVAPSSSPPAPYSVDMMAADTVGLLDHLGWDAPVRIAGHSMGGWIAETLALDQPERVAAAALMGSANKPTAWEVAITTVERDLAAKDYDLPPLFYATETLRYLPTSDLQDTDVVSRWLTLISDVPVWPNPGRLGQYEAALAWSTDPSRTTRWPEVRVPCLVLAFEHDTDSPPRYARMAADSIPGCTYREVAGSGHLGIMTHVGEVARSPDRVLRAALDRDNMRGAVRYPGERPVPGDVVTASAPIRVCDVGGWTDTWFSGRGKVFNIAVSPRVDVRVRVRALGTVPHRITLDVANFGDLYGFEPGQAPNRHPLLEAVIDDAAIPEDFGLEIRVASDIPAGCSTGTSASVVVALIGALDALTPHPRSLDESRRPPIASKSNGSVSSRVSRTSCAPPSATSTS